MFIKAQLPNALTLANLLCGCMAIWLAHGYYFQQAALLVVLAAVMDVLDGWAARLLHVHSAIGAQLDSLADVVSFGVAPALFLVNYLLAEAGRPIDASFFAPLLLAAFSAYRLARFNVHPTNSGNFEGLPTPANALYLILLPLAAQAHPAFRAVLVHPVGICAVVALQCFFLVSYIPFLSFKGKQGLAQWWPLLVLASIIGLSAALWGALAAPIGMLAYVLLSLAARSHNTPHTTR